jgi:chemotaxis protein MotB
MIPFLHRVRDENLEDNPLWLVVLADMMTTLMLFFLVLFVVSQQSKAAQKELERTFNAQAVVDPVPDPRDVVEFREEGAAQRLRKLFADVNVNERDIRVRLREGLLFPSGSATLSEKAQDDLAQLAQILGQIPNDVIVEGYTDPVPIKGAPYTDNWDLSVARSDAVIARLASQGVAPQRLIASGYGPSRPLAPNDSPQGRLLNRRVEIVIVRGVR